MTKKIYAIMVKKLSKLKNLWGFSPTFQFGGKTLRGFMKKQKYQKFIKNLLCLIVQFEEN